MQDTNTATRVSCEPAQSKCTWTYHKNHFAWKSTGDMPDASPGAIALCAPAQSKSTRTYHKSHFKRKFTGEMPDASPAAIVLCQPAQSKCTWTFHKSQFVRKFTRKMPDTSIEHRALTPTVRTPQCGRTVWGTNGAVCFAILPSFCTIKIAIVYRLRFIPNYWDKSLISSHARFCNPWSAKRTLCRTGHQVANVELTPNHPNPRTGHGAHSYRPKAFAECFHHKCSRPSQSTRPFCSLSCQSKNWLPTFPWQFVILKGWDLAVMLPIFTWIWFQTANYVTMLCIYIPYRCVERKVPITQVIYHFDRATHNTQISIANNAPSSQPWPVGVLWMNDAANLPLDPCSAKDSCRTGAVGS